MPSIKVEPTIPNYPPQGIQAQLDLLYLWNPDVANDLIEQLNKALEEAGADLSAYLTKAEAADTYATQQEVTALSGAVEEVSNKTDTLDSDLKELGDQTASIQQDVNSLKTGKQDTLNASQLSAINSGITSAKVTAYDAYAADISQAQNDATKAENAAEVAQQTANLAGQEAAQALTQLAGKQATLTEPQLNAVNSGITADKVSTYDGYQTDLNTLDGDMTDLGNQVTEIQQNINTLNTTVSEKANTADLPQNQTGTTGQVYTKTATGGTWQDATTGNVLEVIDFQFEGQENVTATIKGNTQGVYYLAAYNEETDAVESNEGFYVASQNYTTYSVTNSTVFSGAVITTESDFSGGYSALDYALVVREIYAPAQPVIATVAGNIITEELGNNIVRVSGQENFGTLAQQATTEHPITLPLTMAGATYSVIATAASTGGMAEINCGISAVTTTGFTLGVRNFGESAEATGIIVSWVVTGQKV